MPWELVTGGGVSAGGVRTATLVIAASNSSDKSKAQADYVCDGINDEVEINDAINVLATLGGGSLVLLEGQFVLSSPIVVKSNIELRGQGHSTVIRALPNDPAIDSLWDAGAIHDIRISDLHIIPQLGGTSGYQGIALWSPMRAVIQRCYIRDCSWGITIYPATGDPPQQHVLVKDNIITTASGVTGGWGVGAIIVQCEGSGVIVCSNMLRAENTPEFGILVSPYSFWNVTDTQGVTVANNIIMPGAAGSGYAECIAVDYASNIVVHGNLILGGRDIGIWVYDDATNVLLHGNMVVNCSQPILIKTTGVVHNLDNV